VDSSWSNIGNWSSSIPVNGDDLVFTTGPITNQPSNNDLPALTLNSITFANATFTGPLTLGGNALTLNPTVASATTLSNLNVTAGRNVTIANNLNIAAAQGWTSASDADAITTITGNLSGNGNITLVAGSGSNNTTLPNYRLAGANSGYSGTITTTAADIGILLASPAAMTGGLIDLNSGNRNLWLTGNSPATPYTFHTGNTAGVANINFRNAGTSGLYATGGDIYWNPTSSGNDYEWNVARAGTNSAIRLNGTNDSTPRMYFFGNSSGSLVLGGNRSIDNGGGGNGGSLVTMNFALSDDGTARQFTTSASMMILTRPTGGPGTPNLTGTIVVNGGLAVSNMNQLFDGWLNINTGVMVLDNISWSNFMTDRSAGYRASAGVNNTWGISGGGGFAARTTPLNIVIDNATPSSAYGTITAQAVFDRNFTLGSTARGTDGLLYANQPVTVEQHTVLNGSRTVTVALNGNGVGGNGGFVHTISGNLSGSGSLVVAASGTAAETLSAEVVLSGESTWTGAPTAASINTGIFVNPGAAGLYVGSNGAVVRFNGQASIPAGNLVSGNRNNSGRGGFMFTGNAGGQNYELGAGTSMILATTLGSADAIPMFGADGGKATLKDSRIAFHNAATTSGTVNMAIASNIRSGAELTLGAAAEPVTFSPTFGSDAAASTTATTLNDRNAVGAGTTITKRGEGTLVINNLRYRDLAGSTDVASTFSWIIGRGTGTNTPASSFFDGAIRGLSPNDVGATTANSLAGFWISLRGGVYEIDNSGAGSSIFNRTVSTAAGSTNISIGNTTGTTSLGGGGFSAFGGNVTVDLNTLGTRETLTWASSGSGFVQNNAPLMLGSQTATSQIEFFDNIALNNAVREVRVYDNTNSATDRALISGNLTGTGSSGLLKTETGRLALSGANTYTGQTNVTGGTLALVVSGSLGNTAINVSPGAAFAAETGAGVLFAGSNATSGTSSLTLTGGATSAGEYSMVDDALGTFRVGTGGLTTTTGAVMPTLNFEIGSTAGAIDLLDLGTMGGAATIASGTLVDFSLLTSVTSLQPGDYAFITATSGLGPTAFALNSSTITVGPNTYLLSLANSTATTQILTIAAIPEPGTMAFLSAIGIVGLLYVRKRRQA